MAPYYKPQEAEWIEPIETGYKMACCDCGLVHLVNFRIVDGKVQFQVFRDNRSTGQTRRHNNIKVKKEY